MKKIPSPTILAWECRRISPTLGLGGESEDLEALKRGVPLLDYLQQHMDGSLKSHAAIVYMAVPVPTRPHQGRAWAGNATIRRMAGKANEAKALVIIRKTWIDEAGLSNILEQEHPHAMPSDVKFQAVRVTEYTLADTWFLELEFYPKFLNGDLTAKLLVPKQEVLAVLQTEKPEHLAGFMVPPGSRPAVGH